MKIPWRINYALNNLRRAIVRFGLEVSHKPEVAQAEELPGADSALRSVYEAVRLETEGGRYQPLTEPGIVPEIDSELPIVGFTVLVDNWPHNMLHYTANSVSAVSQWLGEASGEIEPVVRKSDALREINSLSDMVTSLQETIDQLQEELRNKSWGNDGAGPYVIR